MKIPIITIILGGFINLAIITQGDPSNEPFLFEPVGEMATSMSYLHTMLTLNITSIETQVQQFKEIISQKFIQNATSRYVKTKTFDPVIMDMTKLYLAQITEIEDELMALKLSLPPMPHPDDHGYNLGRVTRANYNPNITLNEFSSEPFLFQQRDKRALPLLALLTMIPGVLGTSLGIYNTAQIAHVWSEINSNSKKINSLIKVAEEQQAFLKYLDDSINDLASVTGNLILFSVTMNKVIDQIKNRVHKAIHAVQQANHRRLAIDFLSPHDSSLLHARLAARAVNYNMELGIERHSDLFQLELSYFFDSNMISLILHVPVFPKNSLLRLFKLHPFPLPLTDTHLVFPDTKNDILGISNLDSSYSAQYTSIDLLACHRVNQRFFCDRNGVLQSNTGGSCLSSLYQQDFQAARIFCRFYLEPLQEYVTQLLENWFLIFSPRPQTAPIICQNGTRKELHLPQGTTRFHLSPGCTITLGRHKICADNSIRLPSDFLQIQWKWDPLSIVNATLNELETSLTKMAETGISRPQLNELQLLLNSVRSENTWFGVNYYYIVDGILAILIGIVFVFLGYRIYAWKRESSTPPPLEISQPSGVIHQHFEMAPMAAMGHQMPPPSYPHL